MKIRKHYYADNECGGVGETPAGDTLAIRPEDVNCPDCLTMAYAQGILGAAEDHR